VQARVRPHPRQAEPTATARPTTTRRGSVTPRRMTADDHVATPRTSPELDLPGALGRIRTCNLLIRIAPMFRSTDVKYLAV
jgi:hypothetical protein